MILWIDFESRLDQFEISNFSQSLRFGLRSARGTGGNDQRVRSARQPKAGSFPPVRKILVRPADAASVEVELIYAGTAEANTEEMSEYHGIMRSPDTSARFAETQPE